MHYITFDNQGQRPLANFNFCFDESLRVGELASLVTTE